MSKSKKIAKREVDKNDLRKYSLAALSVLSNSDRNVIAEIFFKERRTLLDHLPQREAWAAVENFHLETDELEIARIRKDINEHDNFIERKEEELLEAQRQLDEKKKELERAKYELFNAQTKVNKARTVLKAAQSYHSELEENLVERKKILQKRQSHISQMNSIVLVHKSASIKQMDENQYAYIVVTASDACELEFIKPDQIFESEFAESFVESLPKDFYTKYSEKEQKSIIEFSEMVINFQLNADEKQKIIPLYANKDISDILYMNGIEN